MGFFFVRMPKYPECWQSCGSCASGDVFHWPAGHSVRVEEDADLVLFSPQSEHTPVIEHIKHKMGV